MFLMFMRDLPGVAFTVRERQWVAHVMELDPEKPGTVRVRDVSAGSTAEGAPDLALMSAQPQVASSPPPTTPEPQGHVRVEPPTSRKRAQRRTKAPPPPKKRAAHVRVEPAAVDQAATCPPDDPACSLGIMGGVCALPAPLFVPSASGPPQKQVARYCVVDAENLVPSHVPWQRFKPNPAYPRGVQERRYDRDKGEQLKVIGVAQQLNPELIFTPAVDAIQGPPVITEDGVVLGGNGRSMALQLHYLAHDDAAAKASQYLLKHRAQFGFTEKDLKRIKQPVLVRVVKVPDKDPKTLATLVRRYNESASQGLDARAAAAGEARRMDDASLTILGNTLPDDATLAEYLASRASVPFVDSLRVAGIVNQRNATALLTTDGLLNDDGRLMVERILTAALIPDPNLLEDVGPQLRGTLARAAPYILAAAAAAEPEWDLRPAIQAAARDIVRARAQNMTTVEDYLKQGALLTEVKPAVDGVPEGEEVLRMLWNLGSKPLVIARAMREYLAVARQNPRGQESLFPGAKATPAQALLHAGSAA